MTVAAYRTRLLFDKMMAATPAQPPATATAPADKTPGETVEAPPGAT